MHESILDTVAARVLVAIENVSAAEAFASQRPPVKLAGILYHGDREQDGEWIFDDGDPQGRHVFIVDHAGVDLCAEHTYTAEVVVVRGHPDLSSPGRPCVVKVTRAKQE